MKCKECLNSRLILSENGWHAICTLSQENARDCLVHGSKFHQMSSYIKFDEKKEGE